MPWLGMRNNHSKVQVLKALEAERKLVVVKSLSARKAGTFPNPNMIIRFPAT
jgi:hypothetical protein